MKKIPLYILMGAIALYVINAVADKQGAEPSPAEVLAKNLPDLNIESVNPSPIAGLYEVTVSGRIVYFTLDGRYMVAGDIFDHSLGGVNLTTQALMKSVSEDDMIVFAPKKTRYTVTVFTDTSCGFCRKLHQEVPELNKRGVKVRYMLYPRDDRGEFNSPGYMNLQSVWCADNQQEAMNTAKAGGKIPQKACTNPIRKHVALAQALGLRGTPLMVTEKGNVTNGYLPVDRLVEMLESGR